MATVRITNDIRNHVRRAILALYNSRVNAIHQKIAQVDMTPFVTNFFREELMRKAAELNSDPKGEWITEMSQQTFQLRLPDTSNGTRMVRVTIPYRRPIPVPIRAQAYSFAIPLPLHSPEHEQLEKLLIESDRITKEGNDLVNRLLELLNSCGTLRQVLDVWPTALEFMPLEVITQHNRVVEKKSRTARESLSIDDSMKAALLTARLLAGKKT